MVHPIFGDYALWYGKCSNYFGCFYPPYFIYTFLRFSICRVCFTTTIAVSSSLIKHNPRPLIKHILYSLDLPNAAQTKCHTLRTTLKLSSHRLNVIIWWDCGLYVAATVVKMRKTIAQEKLLRRHRSQTQTEWDCAAIVQYWKCFCVCGGHFLKLSIGWQVYRQSSNPESI